MYRQEGDDNVSVFARISWLVVLMVCPLLTAIGQNMTTIDSLRQEIVGKSGIAKFDMLNVIGFEYRYSFPDSTIFYCNQAYELGKEIGVEKDLSKPLSFMGLAYSNKGQYNKSAEYHELAIKVAEEQQDSIQLGFGYNNLSRMYFDGGDLERATVNLIQAKEIFEALNDKSGLAYVHRSLANIYKSQGDYEQAVAMSTKALELRKAINDKRSIVSSLIELGLIYESINQTELALANLSEAETIAKQINDRVTIAEIEQATAEILFYEKKYEEAYAHAKQVLTIVSGITNLKLYIRASMIKGKYMIWRKNYAEAVPVFSDIIQRAEQSGFLVYQIEATQLAADCYHLLGDNQTEQTLRTREDILTEKIKNIDLQQQIERLEFQLQITRKEKENEWLKASQAKSEVLISAQRFQNRLLIVLIITISVASVFLWSFNRKRKLVNQKLKDQNAHILQQQEEITRVNEDLRLQNQQLSELNYEKVSLMNIVAHDLKSPLNRIAGLAGIMELEGGLAVKQQEYLGMIKHSTRAGTSMIIDLLDVNAFEENGQQPAIKEIDARQWLTDRINSFMIAADAKLIRLLVANQLSGVFYSDVDYLNRIFDNLVSNALKFSPPERDVEIEGKIVGDNLEIRVKDNGPGFSEKDKPHLYKKFKKLSARPTAGESSNGLGLAIVKTLIDRLSGNIQLVSSPGKGSEFIVTLPIRKKN